MADSRTYLSEAEERRFVLRLLEYWQVVRAGRNFPTLSDIEFNDMGRDAASCAVLCLGGDDRDTRLVHVGRRLIPDAWTYADGRRLSDVPADTLLSNMVSHLDAVLDKRVPVSMGGAFTVYGRPVLGRSILLPLSTDGRRISHVFGGINFKVVHEPVYAGRGGRAAMQVGVSGSIVRSTAR